MAKTYTIREFDSFANNINIPGYTSLPTNTFENLEEFILSNNSKNVDAVELMGISARKGVGKIITAKNYVGVISMKDGTTIEILPKIYSDTDSISEAKKLLVNMLKTLKTTPYKSMQKTNVNIDKLNIFEIFIKMFIDEVFAIVKHGLKCNYASIQDNLNVFKGKMIFSKQIRYNLIHKEKCYIEYDDFNVNRAENRLLKSTLIYLYKRTTSQKNKNDIRTLLNSFTDVCESKNYDDDFSKCIPERNMKGYNTALMWSRVFLHGKSFSSFSGSKIAFALLFPMETLFESYIATHLRRLLKISEYRISTQDKTYHLFDVPDKKFLIRPDIVVKNMMTNSVYVLDTKWKILSDSKTNYGISQSDMYQMYAYQKKYIAENVTLIYPLTDKIDVEKKINFSSNDGVSVKARFVDLFNLESSLLDIVNDF